MKFKGLKRIWKGVLKGLSIILLGVTFFHVYQTIFHTTALHLASQSTEKLVFFSNNSSVYLWVFHLVMVLFTLLLTHLCWQTAWATTTPIQTASPEAKEDDDTERPRGVRLPDEDETATAMPTGVADDKVTDKKKSTSRIPKEIKSALAVGISLALIVLALAFWFVL